MDNKGRWTKKAKITNVRDSGSFDITLSDGAATTRNRRLLRTLHKLDYDNEPPADTQNTANARPSILMRHSRSRVRFTLD